jgi:hypothetical protein
MAFRQNHLAQVNIALVALLACVIIVSGDDRLTFEETKAARKVIHPHFKHSSEQRTQN